MSVNYKIVFQNAIGAVEFSVANGIVIENIASLTQQNVSFETTKANRQIGEKLEHERVEPKTINVRGYIMKNCDVTREQMVHVIAPLSEGKLIFNDTYELTVRVKASPDISRNRVVAKFNFSLYAPYPYWQNKEKAQTMLVGLKGLFSFPWNISDPNPFSFSEATESGYVTVRNDGEAPAYWTVVFAALNEVTNPRIYNMETGQYVKILKTLNAGERITISTEGDELSVTFIGADGVETDGFPYLDVDSEPFKLAVGENFIKTDADSNTMGLRASITFNRSYVGV